jgi:predicted DNA-binding transcriptional regulator AlpA
MNTHYYPSLPTRDPYLTEREVAEVTKISLATLRRWRLLGRGPRFHKLGACVRYRHSEVEAWVNDQPSGGADRRN